MHALDTCGFEALPHPRYSPDLAPSDFHLFSNLKRDMRAIHFNRDEEVKNFVENWLSEKAQNFFLDGINNLKVRLEKCISNLGGYVEK